MLTDELTWSLGQLTHQPRRQFLSFPVAQSDHVDGIVQLGALEDLQKVLPALAAGACEVGKQLVAQRRGITILALMACPSVVGADVRRNRQGCRQQLGLLLVKMLFVFGQDAVELARRNIDAVFPQLLQQQRLRDHRLVILVQDVGDQARTKVTTLDRQDALGKRRQHRAAAG